MINGIINIYKEKGYTSHDVIAKLRGILKQKKIGHTGTLDPNATGVLPVCLGNATKLCDLITDKDKTYKAVMKLGIVTDTQDITGKILHENKVDVTYEEIRQCIMEFVGESMQLPPMYSALKVNGKKLYELARQGKEIERKKRKITINSILISNIDIVENRIEFVVECSKGTYIRTLCNDIGEKLKCGAVMEDLVRIKVGRFSLEESITLSEVEKLIKNDMSLKEKIINTDDMFLDYKKVIIEDNYNKKIVYNGNCFKPKDILYNDKEKLRVYVKENNKEKFIGLYEYLEDKNICKVIKMFL